MTELSIKDMRNRSGTMTEKIVRELNTPTHTSQVGTSASPLALAEAGECGLKSYYSTAMTSDTSYGHYLKLDATGSGVEAIAGRFRTYLKADDIGNAHGLHATLEADATAGGITGLGTGLRANLVLPNAAMPAGGTYYGAMAEIYCGGNSSDISTVTKHAILNLAVSGGNATSQGKVKNAIALDCQDGTGEMAYTATDSSPTFTGSIRILLNGTAKYIHFSDDEAAGS